MRNTYIPTDTNEKEPKEKVYTPEEIAILENKYKELKLRILLDQPTIPLLDKNRVQQQSTFSKEIIIYDQNTGKWKLVKKDENKNS